MPKRGDETTSSDGTEELFEDAVDTLQLVAHREAAAPQQKQCPITDAKSPPVGPPPPLPQHLLRMTASASAQEITSASLSLPISPSSNVLLISSPTSPIPPPLPPRRLLPKNPSSQSSTATPSQTVAPIMPTLSPIAAGEAITATLQLASSTAVATTATASAALAAHQNQTPTELLKKSAELHHQQIQTVYGRQRGHTKTNSLDRGLSLAKCMKTGPFPPPTACSKSNSLTRGASPSDLLPILDEQDQSASTVIQGVIQQVLSENNSLAEEGSAEEEENEMNKENMAETNASEKPSTSIAHYENLADPPPLPSPPPLPPMPPKFAAKITSQNFTEGSSPFSATSTSPAALPRTSQSERQVITTISHSNATAATTTLAIKSHPRMLEAKKYHKRSASDRSPASKMEKMLKVKPTHQKSSTWEPQSQQKLFYDAMDPITRDVERRMSLKSKVAEAQTAKSSSDINTAVSVDDSADDDDVFGTHQHKHTGLDHMRRFARSYGAGAADFFRGAVRKAKQLPEQLARGSTNRADVSGKKASDTIIGGENEDSSIADSDVDQLSIAAAASESLAPTPLGRKWRGAHAELASGGPASGQPAAAPFARTGVCRPKNAKKGPFDFEQLALVQEMNHEHTGAVWCVKFSDCGRLLATAGQDRNVRVWVLRSQLNHFSALRERCQEATGHLDYSSIGNLRADIYDFGPDDGASTSGATKNLDTCSMDAELMPPGTGRRKTTATGNAASKSPSSAVPSLSSSSSFASSSVAPASSARGPSDGNNQQRHQQPSNSNQNSPSKLSTASAVFAPKPLCVFRGHTADVLALSWSPRNYFLLSSGMDRTAKLWHLTRNDCLCSFQHIDFVTCLAFMPKDDRYFISGSLDGKIRMWHISEKKVAIWNEVEQVNKFITAMTYVKNGKFVVVGTYLGRCFFYTTDQLKYHTVIDVRSSRSKNSEGHKITSLAVHGDKLLVASNDSRIRIYDIRDMECNCKFKGVQINQCLVRAAFSPDGMHVVSGSEDTYIYLWRTGPLPSSLGMRKDRNHAWERVRAHQSAVTTAVFAPKPQMILSWLADQQQKFVSGTLEPSSSSSMLFSASSSSPPHPSVSDAAVVPRDKSQQKLKPQQQQQRASSTVKESLKTGGESDRASLAAISSRFALPTANLSELQHNNQLRKQKLSTASLGYSSSSLLMSVNSADLAVAMQNGAKGRRALGDVIVSADLTGSLKVFVNATMQAGASRFFPY